MLPKSITRVLTFFDIFGYNTGSSKLSSRRKYLYTINLVHVSLAIFFTLFKVYLTLRLRVLLRLVEILNQLLQYSTAQLTYWLIIMDSIIYRREHQHFWQILEKVNNSFFPQSEISFRGYALKCIIYTVIGISSFAVSFSVSFNEPIFFVIFFLMQICQIRVLFYTYCLEVIQLQLKVIEIELKRMSNENAVLDHNIEIHRFKWIRGYYHCMYLMTDLLNEVFGYSNVAAVTLTFYISLCELSWICSHFDELIHESYYIALAWVAHAPILTFYLFQGTTNNFKAMKKIIFALNDIGVNSRDAKLSTQIETTQLHIIHHSMEYHARGYFLINNETFLKFSFTIIVFTSIYIQFYQSD